MLPRVCIVTLNFNGWADTLECIASLCNDTYPNKEIVVIDNGSTDDSVDRLRKAFPQATLIETRKNLGFTGGNNVGLQHALSSAAKYIYWLNNDTTSEPDAITKLVAAAEANPRYGILTPRIQYFDKPIDPWFAGAILNLSHGVAIHDNSRLENEGIRDVPWISGCAMFGDARLLAEVGGFDDRFFLYWEDVDLSIRVQKKGRDLGLVSAVRIYHKVSRTASANPEGSRYYYVRNNLLLVKLQRKTAGWFAMPRVMLGRLREGLRESRHAGNTRSLRMTLRAIFDYSCDRLGQRRE